MSSTLPLCHLLEINSIKLSKEANQILEAELFTYLCKEFKEIFRQKYTDYFRLMKMNKLMENMMLETNCVRLIIDDILATEAYTLEGIACYTDTHEDIIHEIMIGRNTDPSYSIVRKIIELHKSVRPNLYNDLVNKIIKNTNDSIKKDLS